MTRSVSIVLIILASLITLTSNGQAFRKHQLYIGLSEGSTSARVTTGASAKNYRMQQTIPAVRDPLAIEYGVTDHLGMGISFGNDIFSLDPATYYGFKAPGLSTIEMKTSEMNFEVSYHVFSTRRLDLCSFSSWGTFGISSQGTVPVAGQSESVSPQQVNYAYKANGSVWRTGSRVKYYFGRHAGAMAMVSMFSGKATPKQGNGTTFGQTTTTSISGLTAELGICFRFF